MKTHLLQNRASHAAIAALLTLLVSAPFASAQYVVDWYTVDGGGFTFSTGGGGFFEIGGTIGQPDAGVMTNAPYEIRGGFWVPNVAIPCPGDLTGDRVVDSSDLGQLLANWMAGPGGDADGDLDTDESDLGIILANWTSVCP